MITKFCCFITLGLLLQLSSSGVAQTLTPIAPIQAPNLYADAPNKTFEISNVIEEPVRVDLVLQPTVQAIDAKLVDVALGDRHDQSLMTLFTAELEKLSPDAKTSPALLVRVKSSALRSGTYKLRIEIRPANSPDTKTPQFMLLEIKLPAAEIKALDKVVVSHTQFSPTSDDPVNLWLTELSGKVRLTDVKIVQTYPTSEYVGSSETVSFAPLAEIKPNETGASRISLNGEIPLGTSTIAAMVSAPQLEKPIFVTIEVRSRRTKLLIVIVMVLGLVLGFVARVWTKQRVESEEARLKAIDAAQTVKRALAAHPDTTFEQSVRPRLTALEAMLPKGTVADLNNQITVLNEALRNALVNLDTRRANATSQLEGLTRFAKNTSSLPTGIKETVVVDDAGLQQARAALDLDNVTSAEQTLQSLIAKAGTNLGQSVQDWRAPVKSLLDQVMQISDFLDQNLSAGLAADKAKLSTELDALNPTTDTSSLEDISTLASSVKRVGAEVDIWLKNRVPVQLNSQFNALHSVISKKRLKKPETMVEFFDSAEKLPTQFAQWADDPSVSVEQSSTALNSLKVCWREALVSQIDDTDAETKKKVQASLDKNQFLEATQTTISTLPDKETILGSTSAITGVAASAFSSIPFLDIFEGRAADAGFTILNTVRKQTVLPSLGALRARTMAELFAAKALRFIIASIIIFGIGYALFANTFIGTLSELMTIFVWAFGLNISVDTVMDSINVRKIG
jgi:hypothetical protein